MAGAVLDTTLVGAATGNGVNSQALSGFSTGGTNRLILVEIDETQTASTVSSVTATGLTFTKFGSVNKGSTQGNVEIWGAWAATQQTSVVITVNFTGANFPQCALRTQCWSGTADGSVSITNAYKSTNVQTFSSGNSGTGSPTVNLTTTANNSQVTGAFGMDGTPTVTAGTSQTKEGMTTLAGQFAQCAAIYLTANTATSGTVVTVNATLGAVTPVGIVAIEILAPGGAPIFIAPQQKPILQAVNRASTY